MALRAVCLPTAMLHMAALPTGSLGLWIDKRRGERKLHTKGSLSDPLGTVSTSMHYMGSLLRFKDVCAERRSKCQDAVKFLATGEAGNR